MRTSDRGGAHATRSPLPPSGPNSDRRARALRLDERDHAFPGGLGPDDLIYLSSLQERLSRVQQDLAAALEVGNAHSMDLLTNNTPENVARVSFLTELNSRVLRELEREQADLELRKLEFRALKK